jgi:carbon storage regulator
LSRRPNERIHIGQSITIVVLRIKGNSVHLGIEAPQSTRIKRAELADREEDTTAGSQRSVVPKSCPARSGNAVPPIRIDSQCPARNPKVQESHHPVNDCRRRCGEDRWTVTSMRQRVQEACAEGEL